jgi:hypothetical protein
MVSGLLGVGCFKHDFIVNMEDSINLPESVTQ